MARTKRSRRSYDIGEWGRIRVRIFPDPKTGIVQIEWRDTRGLNRDSGTADPGSVTASSDSYSPTHAGTTFQELFGVGQGLVARAGLAATLADSDGTSVLIELDGLGGTLPSGGRDVQLRHRPPGSGLAHHEDVCASASIKEEKPTHQPLALASDEACQAVPVGDRIPQLDKRRANAIEPSRLNGDWPTQHPRCTRAPS